MRVNVRTALEHKALVNLNKSNNTDYTLVHKNKTKKYSILIYQDVAQISHVCYLFSLETPPLDHRGKICVQFDYHMNGNNIGELKVFDSETGAEDAQFEKRGSQEDEWLHAAVTMDIDRDDKVRSIWENIFDLI